MIIRRLSDGRDLTPAEFLKEEGVTYIKIESIELQYFPDSSVKEYWTVNYNWQTRLGHIEHSRHRIKLDLYSVRDPLSIPLEDVERMVEELAKDVEDYYGGSTGRLIKRFNIITDRFLNKQET